MASIMDPSYDREGPEPVQHKLLICAAPRTSSNMLARALMAAGIGLPAEYFYPDFCLPAAERWGCPAPSHDHTTTAAYLETLQARRSVNGVFASKLQFWQFQRFLTNPVGQSLFEGAKVVFLLREDIAAQAASFAVALETGTWETETDVEPLPDDAPMREDLVHRSSEDMLHEESSWRRFFLLAGISPLILPDRVVNRDTRRAVSDIADLLGVEADETGLTEYLDGAKRYGTYSGRKDRYKAYSADVFGNRAFEYEEYNFKTRLKRVVGKKVSGFLKRSG
ncbi:MAG: Stf0 family sulfotransferase [Pseudomonadota bacterium]